MSRLNPTHPALCLRGSISSVENLDLYPHNDDSGLFNKFTTYIIEINNITPQTIFDQSTRIPGQYDAIDVKAGDYITGVSGEIVLRIKRILEKTQYTLRFEAEDVDGITYRQYGINKPSTASFAIIFELSENGIPVFAGDALTEFKTGAIDKIQSRFSIDEDDERYRFIHEVAPDINIGEIVTIDSSGNLVRHGTEGAAATPVGTALSKSRNGQLIYVKPFNKIIDNFPDPTSLTGSPASTYYTDAENPGQISTIKGSGSNAIYLQLTNASPTVVTSTSSTALPDVNDVIRLNNVMVYSGPDGDVVNNSVELASLINNKTAMTAITATAIVEAVSVETDSSLLLQNAGAVLSVVTTNGTNPSPTYQYVEATFNDGTTSVTIQFDPTPYGITPQPFANSVPDYLVLDANAMVEIMNDKFKTNGLNLNASVIPAPDGSQMTDLYSAVKIQATKNSASVNITNVSSDAFGSGFAGPSSNSGLKLSTLAGTDAFLTLTRHDGGDILITGGSSLDGTSSNITDGVGYINSNGICSSSMGSPPSLLMIKGVEADFSADVGIGADNDYDMSPNQTTGNYQPTGLTITYTPFLGSKVDVKVNGIDMNLGESNNYSQKTCYFSPDGFTIRDFNTIAAGDELYWNGEEAGFNLDPSDDIDFIYQTSAANN